jgi:hypothetical protein
LKLVLRPDLVPCFGCDPFNFLGNLFGALLVKACQLFGVFFSLFNTTEFSAFVVGFRPFGLQEFVLVIFQLYALGLSGTFAFHGGLLSI